MVEPSFSSERPVSVDYILQLRQKGMSDHAIIEQLENQGFSSIDIFESLTKADEMQGTATQGQSASQQNIQAAPQSAQPQAPQQGQQQANLQMQPQQQVQDNSFGSFGAQSGFDSQNSQQTQGQQQSQSTPQSFNIQESSGQSLNNNNNNTQNASQNNPFDNTQSPQRSSMNPFARRMQKQNAPQEPANNSQIQEPGSFLKALETDNNAGAFNPSQTAQNPSPGMQQDPYPNALSYQTSQNSVVSYDDASIDKFDEIAEAIIDEKWKELKGYVEKIIEWKSKVENRIIKIEHEMESLENQVVGLQKALMQKVQNYDRHITDVATEIKAMEKVFQKIIPSLTDNVTQLSSVVSKMKNAEQQGSNGSFGNNNGNGGF